MSGEPPTTTAPEAPPSPEAERHAGSVGALANKIALNAGFQAFRQVFAMIAGVASVGITSRYLSIDDYGAVIAAQAFVGLLSMAGEFGIGAIAIREAARQPERERAILSGAFWAWITFLIPTVTAILVLSRIAYSGGDDSVTRNAILVLLVVMPIAPFGSVAGVRATLQQRVWIQALTGVFSRAASLLGTVLAAALDLGPLGITAAIVLAPTLDALFAIAIFRPRIGFRLGLQRALIKEIVWAAAPLGFVVVINFLYFRLDAFLLSLLGSQRDVAIYGVAYKAFDMVLTLPGMVMVTLLPELARLRAPEARFQDLVQKAFGGMCILVAPIAVLALLGRPAIIALGGRQYTDGGTVVALIVLATSFACLQQVFGNTLVTQGRQGALFKTATAVLVFNGVANAALIPLWGVHGAATALLASEILQLVLTMWVYKQVAPLPRVPTPLRLGAAMAAMAAAISVRYLISDEIVGMFVAGAAGLVVYGCALHLLGALPAYMLGPVHSIVQRLRPGRAT